MLANVREAIVAIDVNQRGQVDMIERHRRDGTTQIAFKAILLEYIFRNRATRLTNWWASPD